MLIEIREERPDDIAAIGDVNQRAFGQAREGNIVDALRSNGAALLSLVATLNPGATQNASAATLNTRVVGHIMYSPATIGDVTGAALGPMSVLPEHQRLGIGSKLVSAGNQKLRDTGYPFIIVLGHPNFYPRFGFRRASSLAVKCEWDVPDDVVMLLILDEPKMQGVSGLVKYRHEFLSVI